MLMAEMLIKQEAKPNALSAFTVGGTPRALYHMGHDQGNALAKRFSEFQ